MRRVSALVKSVVPLRQDEEEDEPANRQTFAGQIFWPQLVAGGGGVALARERAQPPAAWRRRRTCRARDSSVTRTACERIVRANWRRRAPPEGKLANNFCGLLVCSAAAAAPSDTHQRRRMTYRRWRRIKRRYDLPRGWLIAVTTRLHCIRNSSDLVDPHLRLCFRDKCEATPASGGKFLLAPSLSHKVAQFSVEKLTETQTA